MGSSPASIKNIAIGSSLIASRQASKLPPPSRWWGATLTPFRYAGSGKILIAYATSDLKLSHPIGQLMVPILKSHDRLGCRV
jgi:hypothetical protein